MFIESVDAEERGGEEEDEEKEEEEEESLFKADAVNEEDSERNRGKGGERAGGKFIHSKRQEGEGGNFVDKK